MSASDQANLLKLPREQLKQLCRERGHTGYSKCTKPQLVALLGSDTPTKFNVSMMATVLPAKQDASSSSVSKKRLEPDSSGPTDSVAKKQKLPSPITSSSSPPMQFSTASAPSKTKRKPRVAQKPPNVPEPSVPPVFAIPATAPLPDQQPSLPPVSQLLPLPVPSYSLSLGLPQPLELTTKLQPAPLQFHSHAIEKEKSGTPPLAMDSTKRPPEVNERTRLFKKFLYPRTGAKNSHLAPSGPQDTLPSTIVNPPSNISAESPPSPYLDFSVFPVPVLGLIGMPPSISNRKKVRSWSIFLSGISDPERRACILVSRMFRYAVYMSAAVILSSNFPGKRLDNIVRSYSPSTFNFWPYLRARKIELTEQRSLYLQSFLHRFYENFEPVDRRLWASPDNPKQYAVAVRFVMTKSWFAISKCPSPSDTTPWLHSVVMNVREVIPGEVWEVTTMTVAQGSIAAKEETFYVLEPTCEVIGHPPTVPLSLPGIHPNTQRSLPIRIDWSEYITDRIISLAEGSGKRLLDRVQWANYEEYQNGIGRHWLTRTRGEGEVGELKRRVAEKYVLASVVENSVSGPWRSVQEMANESFVSAEQTNINKRLKIPMKMFLSAHHHVESVHFQTPDKKAFHPAVATVQTLAREYFILKDNGMLIGTEEGGVNPLWQVLLECDERGLPCDGSAPLSATH